MLVSSTQSPTTSPLDSTSLMRIVSSSVGTGQSFAAPGVAVTLRTRSPEPSGQRPYDGSACPPGAPMPSQVNESTTVTPSPSRIGDLVVAAQAERTGAVRRVVGVEGEELARVEHGLLEGEVEGRVEGVVVDGQPVGDVDLRGGGVDQLDEVGVRVGLHLVEHDAVSGHGRGVAEAAGAG